MPIRETLTLMPSDTSSIMYAVMMPFAIVFFYGLYLRLRSSNVLELIAKGSGGWLGAVKRLTIYALGQRRVAEKPRGWPHLGIFYGFLALLVGTTLVATDWDLLRPLGFRLLSGTRYLVFEIVLDLFGAFFVVGLVAALFSRLQRMFKAGAEQRRIQLQFVCLIVGLLYMGITGFFLEGLRLTLNPVAWAQWNIVGVHVAQLIAWLGLDAHAALVYPTLWWSHAVVAFSLIAFLPFTVFLHSVSAPLNVMVYSGAPRTELPTPFDLREVIESGNYDVKSGAMSLSDLEQVQRFALLACTNCGRCEDACPAFAIGTELSPRRLVQKLRWKLLADDIETDLLTEGDLSSGELWACTTCAACVPACPVFIRPVDYIVPFRRELVSRQQLDKRQTELLGNLGLASNPYGMPPSNRTRLAEEMVQRDS